MANLGALRVLDVPTVNRLELVVKVVVVVVRLIVSFSLHIKPRLKSRYETKRRLKVYR